MQNAPLQYFRPSLSYHLTLRSLCCLFLSGRLRQVPRGLGDLGRRVIYFQGALVVFQGSGEQAHNFRDLGSPAKSKKINLKNPTLKEKPPFCLIKKNFVFRGPDPAVSCVCDKLVSHRYIMCIFHDVKSACHKHRKYLGLG